MNVEATLTRAELAAPFRVPDTEAEPIDGPTRTALEIEDLGEVFVFIDRDPDQDFASVDVQVLRKDNH